MTNTLVPATKNGSGNGHVPAWHTGFVRMMPVIRRHARALFRYMARPERDEAVAEVIAVALVDYVRYLEDGVSEAVDPNALAAFAVRTVRNGGRACGQESSRDVLSPTAQHRRGFTVERLKGSRDSAQPQKRLDLREDSQEFARQPPPKAHANGDAGQAIPCVVLIQERARHADTTKQLADHQIEFEIARRIQRNLLPSATLVLPGFEVGGVVYPAAATGGDYFDYVPMPNGAVGVVVGDVSGHGYGPALLMASTRAHLRAFAQTQSDLGKLLMQTDLALNLDTAGEQFVTAILVRLDLRKRSLVYASAGHPAGYILDVSGHVRIRLPSTGPVLGIATNEGFAESPVIPLRAGEFVLLLSDGVTEASAPCGAAFGWMRAVKTVRHYRHDPPVHIAMNLYHAVRAFAQEAPQLDDITAVVIKVTPDDQAPGQGQGGVRHAGIITEVP
jgi:serine phosphatase RsbU (regulator of sigma subunit)